MNKKIAVYVPSNVQGEVRLSLQSEWTDKTLNFLTDLFGGATAIKAVGAWKDGNKLVKEDINIVYAFTDEAGLAQLASVRDFCRTLAGTMKQQCVSLETPAGLEFWAPYDAARLAA